jgi:vacuolar-type H+-ATPase subunit I/STV1
MTVVPKKSILEKMGFIDPIEKEVAVDETEEITSDAFDEDVPEPDYVPDLTMLDDKESQYVENPVTNEYDKNDSTDQEPKDIPKDISDKLDLIIGAYEKNKMMTIDEIYRNAQLETEVKKTIFMADVYQKAIPENLPLDIKRETVLNIMSVSNVSLDELLNDAYKRIDSLNTVLEETVTTTQEIFSRNEATIRELEKRIEDLKEINRNRKKFQEDQNTMIEYEIQKIINLVEFVKPKK